MNRLLILSICIAALFVGCKKKAEVVVEEKIRAVKFANVKSAYTTTSNEFSGVSESGKQSNLSFRVTGNLRTLSVEEGDKVRRGQSLASIDPTDYKVQLEQAQANLKQAEVSYQGVQSQVTLAQSSYKRIESLYENNSVSLSEFENAKTQYENAKAQLDASQAQIDAARAAVNASKNQVSYAFLSAPYSGTIQQINVEVNELVPAGNPVMVIGSSGQIQVSVGIPEIYISQVKKGQKVDVQFSSIGDKVLKGTINEIGYNTENAATYPVKVLMDKTNDALRPGMAARVKFNFDTHKANSNQTYPMVPAEAVGQDANGNYVFVLEEDGANRKVKKQTVSIGKLTQQGYEITGGLQGNEVVATAGLKSLLNGMTVKLME